MIKKENLSRLWIQVLSSIHIHKSLEAGPVLKASSTALCPYNQLQMEVPD